MLVIESNVGSWVRVGAAVIHIGKVKGGRTVKLAIDAPPEVKVEREEFAAPGTAARVRRLATASVDDLAGDGAGTDGGTGAALSERGVLSPEGVGEKGIHQAA